MNLTNEEKLFSPNLDERLEATQRYLASGQSNRQRQHLEGCRGSLNAFAVLVGPSYGAFHGTGEPFRGGNNRPTSEWAKAGIGAELGKPLFVGGSTAREKRWRKLLLACVDGNETAAEHLIAICNLDWGNFGSEKEIPKDYLSNGALIIVPIIMEMRPRVVVPLSRLVWNYLIGGFVHHDAKQQADQVIPGHQSGVWRFPSARFDTLVARPLNHPSRHFLTDERIQFFAQGVQRFLVGQ